jgi:glucokinase
VTRLIGVDVGGTKVSVALLEDGVLSPPQLHPTETSSSEALLDQLVTCIGELLPADAVGLGVPSVIDFATGTARSSVNIPLENLPLRQLLRERLGIPVYVDNDATVAAVAEAHGPDAKVDVRHLVMLTVGTGVGGGIVLDGHVYRGATGAAAEIGHMIVAARLEGDRGPETSDRAPQPGSLERLASGRALDHLAAERGLGDGHGVVEAAQRGDASALEALRILGERLGVGIANVVNVLEPDVVAVGGGVSNAGELLLGPARETARKLILRGVGTKTEIRLARYGPQAGVLGAALMAGQELVREEGGVPV